MAKPAALLADEVGGRHPHVGEAELAVALAVLVAEHREGPVDREPGRVHRDEHHALLEVAGRVGVGLAHDDEDLAARRWPPLRSTTCGR